jgi:hypothetical protein
MAAVPQEPTPATDQVRAALEQVGAALARIESDTPEFLKRSNALARQRASGRSWRAITESEDCPRAADLLRDLMAELLHANSQYRRALARELRAEGATMERIADLLGVTRQRVAHVLKGQEEAEEG